MWINHSVQYPEETPNLQLLVDFCIKAWDELSILDIQKSSENQVLMMMGNGQL